MFPGLGWQIHGSVELIIALGEGSVEPATRDGVPGGWKYEGKKLILLHQDDWVTLQCRRASKNH